LTAGIERVTAAVALKAMNNFAFTKLDQVLGKGGLLVIAPHQDDESLACGGLIAEACASGRDVRILFVSDGAGSHPRSRAFPRTRLRALREAEARKAVFALGLAPRYLEFLRLPDRFVPSDGPAACAATERIAEAATKIHAKAIFVSWRDDPHCDHQAAYALTRAAQQRLGIALYEYSVWGETLKPSAPVTPVTRGFRLSTERHRARKRRAIDAHQSQTTALIADDPRGFRLSKTDLARFAKPYESFIGGVV
jgi:LmbE family N-acetylglucosaminyl deacetylase